MRGRLLVAAAFVAACGAAPAAALAEPVVSRTCNGSQICDAWFRGPVKIDWTYSGTPTGGCVDETIRQDTAGTLRSCLVTDGVETASRSITIKLDQTAPIISGAIPSRPPDHVGWYTRPVTFAPQATDATSLLDGCNAPSYSGPDSPGATVFATCRDKAGNTATAAFPLSYDATPPDTGSAAVSTGDRVVRMSWAPGATASVTRTPGTGGAASSVVYEGRGSGFKDRKVRNERRYRYVLTLTDQAGNSASRELPAVPARRLISPGRRAIVSAPPLLTWTPVRGARYYNVQLFRGGRKVLSAWPKQPSLQLEGKWRFRGKRHRMKLGEYRWYVWPGEVPRSAKRYGKRIGRRSFTVAPG